MCALIQGLGGSGEAGGAGGSSISGFRFWRPSLLNPKQPETYLAQVRAAYISLLEGLLVFMEPQVQTDASALGFIAALKSFQ